MGSSRFQLRTGGAVQVYDHDKGVAPNNRNLIPLYVTDSYTDYDSCVSLTAEEAAAIAHELLERAEALRLSEND